jgi:hypothetical protein
MPLGRSQDKQRGGPAEATLDERHGFQRYGALKERSVRAFVIALGLTFAGAFPTQAADPNHPTVIELYQSQGCASCPPANANLNALAKRPDVLPLSFAVTYWDHLGWKDTFAKPAFTQRQWDYARSGNVDEIWTPQMIVNGRGRLVGNDHAAVEKALQEFDRGTSGPTIQPGDDKVTIGAAKAAKVASVWLVYYDPKKRKVPIRAGENRGRTLSHRNIVRDLQRLGTWNGKAVTLKVPAPQDEDWRGAILVQSGKGGPIIAATRL